MNKLVMGCEVSMNAYGRSVNQVDAPRIDISRERLISLLRRMRDSGKSAWVRLQVVRAVEFYQKSVLQSSVPDLSDVWLTLEELAREAEFKSASHSALIRQLFRNCDWAFRMEQEQTEETEMHNNSTPAPVISPFPPVQKL